MDVKAKSERVPWLDIVKFYGIFLVFYGHFVEKLSNLGNGVAFFQFKFIYAFHVPLFFVISGYLSKKTNLRFFDFFKDHFAARLIPAIFFNLWGMSFLIIQDFLRHSLNYQSYLVNLLNLLRGYPAFNIVTWFLICLFSVEIIHYFLGRYLNNFKKILIYGILFFLFNWLSVLGKLAFFNSTIEITKNFWFIYPAIGAYWFYLLGIYFKTWTYLSKELSMRVKISNLAFSFIIILFTFNLNSSFFTYEISVVIMALASYGNPILFPITAVAGSLFVMFLAKLTPANKVVLFLGKNTLILLGLNGIFHHFINERLAIGINKFLPSSFLPVFVVCSFVALASLLVCIPFIVILNRFFPQLVGKLKVNRSFLRNF